MKRLHHTLYLLALTLLIIPSLSRAEENIIHQIAIESRGAEGERITIHSSAPLEPLKTFILQKPDRVVIDLPRVVGEKPLSRIYGGKTIKAIRFGQFDAGTSRLAIDLATPVTIKNVTPGSPLVVDLIASETPPPAGGRLGGGQACSDQANNNKGPRKLCPHPNPPPAGEGIKQLPLIMIDAGHGGQDPGALGLHKTHERDVTLNFARALKKSLIATGRYRAALTRDGDNFVMLHERVNIARKHKADLMISLHADSNPNPDAKGLSIYTLSATASDAEAAALAEHENKADIITGIDLNTTDADVAGILIDLTQRETMNKSTMLADSIVSKMPPSINLLTKTHRFAGFRVLKAPDVPSVLIELGFLSNATDERLLLSPDYRDLVVTSVVKGIDKYYE